MSSNAFSGNRAKTLVAANAKVIFNGTLIGFVTEASWTIEFGNKPIYTIDSIIPGEIAPGPYRTSFSLVGTRILRSSLEEAGITDYPGLNISAPYKSIAILERDTDTILVNIKAAMIDQCQTTIAAKSIAILNISGTGFVALSNAPQGVPAYEGVPQQMP